MKNIHSIVERHRVVLGLNATFAECDLRAAYRELIRRWHPDQFMSDPDAYANATEKAKELNLAYELLSEVLEASGGNYVAPLDLRVKQWSGPSPRPRRTYEGKEYTVGLPDDSVTEIFLKSSNIVSTGYNRTTRTLYIKFSDGSVYRYFDVPIHIFNELIAARSPGRFGHQKIYQQFRQQRCR